jgi:hypothetical protein
MRYCREVESSVVFFLHEQNISLLFLCGNKGIKYAISKRKIVKKLLALFEAACLSNKGLCYFQIEKKNHLKQVF